MNSIIGCWKLVSYEISNSTEKKYENFPNVSGSLIYSADLKISVIISKTTGIRPSGDDILAYHGNFEIKDLNTVIHSVKFSNIPEYNGAIFERDFTLSENKLILIGNIKGSKHRITWERN